MPVTIRPARLDELEPLLAMQQRSLRVLAAPFYAGDLLEGALARMGTMDPRLIADGTYLIAECEGCIAGSAGWSLRAPTFARLLREPSPALPGHAGIVRSVYVDPSFARRGIARQLMREVEARLARSDADRAESMATLSGVAFYERLGYRAVSDHALMLAGRMEFAVRRMVRPLAAAT